MRGRRLFKTNMRQVFPGKWRWAVCTVGGQSVANGFAKTQQQARTLSRESQEQLMRRYGTGAEKKYLVI